MYQLQKDINCKTEFNHCAVLLDKNTMEAREEFIVKYLPKIKSFADKIYSLYQEELDGFYDYEDFFCDMTILAMELYDSGKFQKTGILNLSNYTKYLMYESFHLLIRTYFVRTSVIKGIESIKVLKIYRDFIENEKRRPTLMELEKITNLSQRKLLHIFYVDSFDDLEIIVPSFENELINLFSLETLKDDLDKALETITEEEKKFICTLNGYGCEMIAQTEYAKRNNTTRQNIHQKAKKIYQKVRDNNAFLESYRD